MGADSSSLTSTRIKVIAACAIVLLAGVLLVRGWSSGSRAEPLAPDVLEAVEQSNQQADSAPPLRHVADAPNEPVSSGRAQPVQPARH